MLSNFKFSSTKKMSMLQQKTIVKVKTRKPSQKMIVLSHSESRNPAPLNLKRPLRSGKKGSSCATNVSHLAPLRWMLWSRPF